MQSNRDDGASPHRHPAGFRFSAVDGVVLAIGAVATWWLHGRIGTWAWLVAVAVGHFFLFCNVVRMRRSYELIWAAFFVVNFGAWAASGEFRWMNVLGIQTPLTVGLVFWEARSPRYHGIFSRPPQ